MKVKLEFLIDCTQCPRQSTYKASTFVSDFMRSRLADAREFFMSTGWTELSSGVWICPDHGQEKEAA
jgi:hypothetical protein